MRDLRQFSAICSVLESCVQFFRPFRTQRHDEVVCERSVVGSVGTWH
jgi:hypothetical protein